ncbi:MAG: right-handed parallel beta-helix repeat-containing protein [Cyanomargarita calcarea GSE-NOS-MK-12-04C]|jgi:hypothetical protein|uniref:Right-handed parallel beta-helix repeat-containing protein n=1 Tax=Cyanomargarita calcarea GSE-NOS-MK-12-04C TaxID=2839659 RepID=A0A951UUY1_9CYAN|nr:right-handed parallel beta-helix repeat-containing protein [Cyanomargarita calcarea GSE-NOS-MK-12-04C]
MKGDFSKWNFDDRNENFNSVLHQQGRVLLDSDWNAQTQLLNDWQTTAGQDIIGAGVAAVPAENPDAFKVMQAKVASNPDRVEIQVQPGRIWADGFLLNLAGKDTLTRQATYLQPPIQNPQGTVGSIGGGVRDAVILEVWQEAFNGFQKPETLIEPALGGPDTTERVQTAMNWRLYRLADDETCDNIRGKLQDRWDEKGKLTVSLEDPTVTNGDCPVVSAGGYTGFEHYLYRVEIADSKDAIPKFKWSQFNGGLVGRGVFQAPSGGEPGKVTITHNLQAIIHSGISDFYLEVIEYNVALGNQQVIYGATASLNNSNELELATPVIFGTEQPVSPPPAPGELPITYFFRLWNGIADIATFAMNPAKLLQDGILLKFDDPSSPGKIYTPGDYWTFKVRAGEIANLSPLVDNQPPEGIVYHRVPVAELNWNAAKDISFANQEIEDCRKPFRPLTNQKVCCTFSVGDGKSSQGDFNSIENAIRHLPPSGGKICVLPGIHAANVDIINRRDIQITGCGVHSIVHPLSTEASTSDPIFRIAFSRNIQIDHLNLVTVVGTAIQVLDDLKLLPSDTLRVPPQDSTGIHILWNYITASIHAIEIRTRNETQAGNNDIWIAHNQIYLLDKPTGKATILAIADGVLIERNRLMIVPPPQENDPQEPRQPNDPSGGAFDPCKPLKFYYGSQFSIYKFVQSIFLYAAKFLVVEKPIYLAQGGIQIGSSSDGVKIIGNEIIGGWGNGITLGHVPDGIFDENTPKNERIFVSKLASDRLERLQKEFVSHLYGISIEENTIERMGLSGIGVVSFLKLETIQLMVQVNDLTIYRNQITQCAQQLPNPIPEDLLGQVGFGGIALTGCEYATIQENRIENNGISYLDPICGVFILFGDRIDISNNYILNNGKLVKKTQRQRPRRGLRGGIFIALSLASRVGELLGDIAEVVKTGLPFDDGVPAVKVHGNVVTQPLGQALFIIAIGPVSVVDNEFTSQDIDVQADFFTYIAGAVFILNLGYTIQELLGLVLLKATQFGKATYNAPTAAVGTTNGFMLQTGVFEAAFFYGTFWPSGKVLFNDNQTTLDLRAIETDLLFSSQFIFTLDDIGFSSNQSDCNTLIDVLVTNTWLMGFSIRTNDNRFREGLIFTLLSLFSFGILNTNTYNQGSHCFLALASSPQLRVDRDNIVLFDQFCNPLVNALTERYS